jgi:predicted amidohydrolase
MLHDVRVALAQFAPRLGDSEANLDRHREICRRARADGASIVVFPELSLHGYVLQDQVPEVAVREGDPTWRRLEELSAEVDVVAGFVSESSDHLFHNAAGYFARGRLVHLHRKVYLPNYGMFEEARYLAAGRTLRAFDCSFGRAGILVCEDLWHPTSAWVLSLDGAEVLFAVSCSPSRGTRPGLGVTSIGVWERLLQVSAQFQTSFLVYVNRVGSEDGLLFAGGSMAVDPFGRVLASLPAAEEDVVTVELEAEVLRRARTAYPLLRDANPDLVLRELERLRLRRYELPAEADVEDVDPDGVAP